MKIPAISGLPVSVTLYTETGLADPQKNRQNRVLAILPLIQKLTKAPMRPIK